MVKDPGLLDSTISQPKQFIFSQDAYLSIYEKAAALFESISKNQAFHNANKRTALASLIIFLKINHYRLLHPIIEELNKVLILKSLNVDLSQKYT